MQEARQISAVAWGWVTGKYAGAVTGAMNIATYVAAFVSSVVYGYIASSFGYTAPEAPALVA
jgi:sugar phosphate permease